MNGVKHPRDWIVIGKINEAYGKSLYMYFTGAENKPGSDKVWPGVWMGTETEKEKLIATGNYSNEIIRSICTVKDEKVTDAVFVEHFRRVNKNILESDTGIL